MMTSSSKVVDEGDEGDEGRRTRRTRRTQRGGGGGGEKRLETRPSGRALPKRLENAAKKTPKEALGEFEMALERCPVHAKRARKTLENARERAMEMVYSGGTCAEDDDDDDDDEDADHQPRDGKANEEEKRTSTSSTTRAGRSRRRC